MSIYNRFVTDRISTALKDTRVVLITGPRQAGKTTLVKQIAGDGTPYFSLDNLTVRDTARSDPTGFIRGIDRAVIDEVQRVPDLLLAIKESVDTDPRPGRFLLTGSSHLMMRPQVADSLAGRMETISLFPLSQGEIRNVRSTFLDQAFTGHAPRIRNTTHAAVGADLVDAVLVGGYPEALTRHTEARRRAWYDSYLQSIIERDIREIAAVEQLEQLPLLLRALAQYTAQPMNYSAIGNLLGMNHTTTRRYIGILSQMFLIRTIPPWYTNVLRKLAKAPKLHFLDTGLLAALRDLSPERLHADRTPWGAVLETFVVTELLKAISWSDTRFELSHFRDHHTDEVDIVIQNPAGKIVGIEVKAAATVTTSDFRSLRKLAAAVGPERFAGGFVVYDHTLTVPFDDRLAAVPISALWC